MKLKVFISLVSCLVWTCSLYAQSALKFENTVHDFGQVLMSDGAVSCSFIATNIDRNPVVIQSVSTSCGCTNVKWNHEPVKPGEKTRIDVTYTNDEGPYPFDKTITVKFAGVNKPTLLHIRGISQNAMKPDNEVFTCTYGQFGLMSKEFKLGNIEQGGSRGDQTTAANLGTTPLKVSFVNVSKGLSIRVEPDPIPAKSHATIYYTVTSSPDRWGYNDYFATPVINGSQASSKIKIRALTADSFSSMTKEEKAKGSRPVFQESTFSFGHKKCGSLVKASFTCTNKGAALFKVYKVDSDYRKVKFAAFPDIAPGKSTDFALELDTSELPKGEALVIVTLTTNSPVRPIVTLFLAGWID